VIAAIDRFQLQRGTATGSGIILSLATLFPDHGIEIQHVTGQRNFPGKPVAGLADKPEKKFTPVEAGSYNSAAVIMLTDGQRTTGPDPLEAAKMAAERGIRVYTVGIGTTSGETIGFDGWSMRVRLDEETLKNISVLTHGEYFYAGTAEDLKKVYEGLSSRMVVERKETEVSALFAGLAALLSVLAAGFRCGGSGAWCSSGGWSCRLRPLRTAPAGAPVFIQKERPLGLAPARQGPAALAARRRCAPCSTPETDRPHRPHHPHSACAAACSCPTRPRPR
jgi:hypothetical protein